MTMKGLKRGIALHIESVILWTEQTVSRTGQHTFHLYYTVVYIQSNLIPTETLESRHSDVLAELVASLGCGIVASWPRESA